MPFYASWNSSLYYKVGIGEANTYMVEFVITGEPADCCTACRTNAESRDPEPSAGQQSSAS